MKRGLLIAAVLLILGAGAGLLIAARVSQKMKAERLQENLAAAEKLMHEEKATEAAQVLKAWRGQSIGGELGERLLALDMKALDASGQSLEALTTAKRYVDRFPKGPDRADAEFLLLKPMIEEDPSDVKVRECVDKFLAQYPVHPAGVRLQVTLARADYRSGKFDDAQKRLLAMVEAGPPASEDLAVTDLLGEINLALLKTPAAQADETVIEIKEGQYLYNIAREHGVPVDFLIEVNQIKDPKKLRIGQKIRIPDVQFSLVCDKTQNTLTVYNHGRFFKSYPVRTGRTPDATPTGEFKILNKKTDPTWRSPMDGKIYKAGDPKNELGTRWMAFEGDILGIHGTIHPDTIGSYASNGCIGMLKDDVEEVFAYLPVGTPLRIVGKQDLTKHDVIDNPEERRVTASAK